MAELTRDEKLDKMMEMIIQFGKEMKEIIRDQNKNHQELSQDLMKKMDNNRQILKEGLSEINKNITSLNEKFGKTMDNINKKLDDQSEKGERTNEMKNDIQPETEEIPNEKTMEQIVVLPEKKTNGNKENTKDMEVCLLYTSRCV